ncbi:MAG: class I SAM-dependent methyltransferase [Bryobacteraceae bacterium]|nr:class I SAM-dependent methyltransferase [Bryobacteraceae bacterium]
MPQDPQVKRSLGLAHFVSSIADNSGLSILDLGEISQPNVTFITTLGHRLYSEDLLRTLDSHMLDGDLAGGPAQPDRIEGFLHECLGFPASSLDGALVWDTLQYVSRPLLLAIVERLHEVLKPGACLLTLFHASERPQELPLFSYRIASPETLHLVSRGTRQSIQFFNNRGIEKLFERFSSVKFFLTRDNIREVIVSR